MQKRPGLSQKQKQQQYRFVRHCVESRRRAVTKVVADFAYGAVCEACTAQLPVVAVPAFAQLWVLMVV
jgi:hypothetical protein